MSINLFKHVVVRFAVSNGHYLSKCTYRQNYTSQCLREGCHDGVDVNVRVHQLF